MIKVKSIKEAWTKADELFPTDYEKDNVASANAGYPIYMSTLDGCSSWISDLNTSLELNIQEGKKFKTVRIVIEEEPEIIEEKVIDADSVRMCCIKHNLYTKGTCRDYDFMLNFADVQGYSLKNLFEVASDICKHSEDQTVENVMFLLGKDAVKTFYHIKG